MIYLWFCLYFVLQHLIVIQSEDEEKSKEDAEFKRFIVEDGMKQAIFGSFAFDPVKQSFDPPPNKNNNKKKKDGCREGISTKGQLKGMGELRGIAAMDIPNKDIKQKRMKEDGPAGDATANAGGATQRSRHWWARATKTSGLSTTAWAYKNLTNLLKNVL